MTDGGYREPRSATAALDGYDSKVSHAIAHTPYPENNMPPTHLKHLSELAVDNIVHKRNQGYEISQEEADVLAKRAMLEGQAEEQAILAEARAGLVSMYESLGEAVPEDLEEMELGEVDKQMNGACYGGKGGCGLALVIVVLALGSDISRQC